MINLEQHRGKM